MRRRHQLYNCGGWRSYHGPCGAPDCTDCNPGYQGYGRCEHCGGEILLDGGTRSSDVCDDCRDDDSDDSDGATHE